jgi:methyltransferase
VVTALYAGFVGLVALQRLLELRISARNARAMLARGGIEVGRGHLRWMIALHVAFLIACPAEAILARRPFVPWLAAPAAALFLAAQALRAWSIASLGDRWSIRVIVLPGEPLVRAGPYRYLRHPNYLAVAVEMAAIPLLHTAWITALAASALDAWLLSIRIRVEEEALGLRATHCAQGNCAKGDCAEEDCAEEDCAEGDFAEGRVARPGPAAFSSGVDPEPPARAGARQGRRAGSS